MFGVVKATVLILLIVSWMGTSLAVTCPPSTSTFTDASRDKMLGAVNRDRELIRKGELLLTNGQYALQGAFMKNLTWDCKVEVKLAETVEAMCNGSWSPYSFFTIPHVAQITTYSKADVSINDHYKVHKSYYLSDVGTTFACAAYQCYKSNYNYTTLLCKTSPSVAKNDDIYVVGSPDVVTTPAPQPSCAIPESPLTPAHRERITNKMNEKRAKVLNGTLLLDNGKYALQAQEMPALSWDCDLEAKMFTETRCSKPDVTPRPNDSNWYDSETYNNIDYYVNELSKTNIEYALGFLSNTTKGQIGNIIMDQRVLHDKATKVGCAFHQCTFNTSTGFPNPVKVAKPMTMLMCTFDVNWKFQIGKIYEPRNASIPDTTTVAPATTTTTTPYNPCAAGWFFHLNACYRFVDGSTGRTQAQAEQWCVNQGKKGHLVSIHTEAEDSFVKSLISFGGENVLIGYNNQAWTDATPVDYNNFATTCGNDVCADMFSPSYQWKSVDCNGPFKQFICKRNL